MTLYLLDSFLLLNVCKCNPVQARALQIDLLIFVYNFVSATSFLFVIFY